MKMLTPHTDIHEAAFAGDYKLLKKLLETNKQNVNKQNGEKQTPLHKASMNGWKPCVDLLIELGANSNATDVAGCTPLHYSASNGYIDICQCLIEEGSANMDAKSNKGYTPQAMARSRGQMRMVAFFNELQSKRQGNHWL